MVRLAVCRLWSVSSVCGARHRLGESGVGSQRGPGDGGKAPQGNTHCLCSSPSPFRMPSHPPRPLPLLIDPSGVQCVARWLHRGQGPLSCRDQPVRWNRVCSEPRGGLPRAHMPAVPRVCCAGSRALHPAHSFPASDLSSDPASRAHLPCSLQDKTWLVGVYLFILCSPSDSRDLTTSLTALSPVPGFVQIPCWVTIHEWTHQQA